MEHQIIPPLQLGTDNQLFFHCHGAISIALFIIQIEHPQLTDHLLWLEANVFLSNWIKEIFQPIFSSQAEL